MTKQLKPFAGEYDMIAAYTAEEASQILMTEFGYDEDESEVQDVSNRLEKHVLDEEGQSTGTLQEYIDGCKGVPQYLYGWE